MIWMPQLLYLLHNSPVGIGKKWFKIIETLFRELIGKKGQARIRLHMFQLPTKEGGLAVPHPVVTFWRQLHHLGGCNTAVRGNASGKVIQIGAPHNTVVEALEADYFFFRNPTLKMIRKVWKTVKILMGYEGVFEYTPLWNNKKLQELVVMVNIREWEIQGINRLVHLYMESI